MKNNKKDDKKELIQIILKNTDICQRCCGLFDKPLEVNGDCKTCEDYEFIKKLSNDILKAGWKKCK